MDKLVIKNLKRLDGEYDFDLVALLRLGDPDYLTQREWHRIKLMSGVRQGEIIDSFNAGDAGLQTAIAAIILSRHGKTFDEDDLWDAPGTSEVRFKLYDRGESEDDAEVPPKGGPLENEQSGPPSPSGGGSSRPTLVSQEIDPSPTGHPDSERSAISAQAT